MAGVLWAWLLAIALTVGACAGKNSPSDAEWRARGRMLRSQLLEDAQRYFPLAKGLRRTYQVSVEGRLQGTLEVVVRGRGKSGAWHDTTGARWEVNELGVRDQYRYVLRVPLTAKRTWTAIPRPNTWENYSIHETGVTLKVPAGTYRNVVMVLCETITVPEDGGPVQRLYTQTAYAPDVGPIQIATLTRDAKGKLRLFRLLELADLHIPPGTAPVGATPSPPSATAAPQSNWSRLSSLFMPSPLATAHRSPHE